MDIIAKVLIYSIMDCCKNCSSIKLCDEYAPNQFLEESRIIGYNKKLDELSYDEKYQFKDMVYVLIVKTWILDMHGIINVIQDDF